MDKSEWRQFFKEVKLVWSLIRDELAQSESQAQEEKEANEKPILSTSEPVKDQSQSHDQVKRVYPKSLPKTKGNRKQARLDKEKQAFKEKLLEAVAKEEDQVSNDAPQEVVWNRDLDFDLIAKDEQAFKEYLDRELRETYADLDDYPSHTIPFEETQEEVVKVKPSLSKTDLRQALLVKEIIDRPKGL
ncbi:MULTISPECIES: hypothetical protein [Aerococcus]|uniref:hypothetical protein n=1 Tax=Aerococcus urinae (strain CCUG 59500 / ACS-120-V-Col10a) TaxID=2976812 RepID=UPI000200E56B|nr:hypothetical protein [Aerococcus sp. Group 1]AEA01497.1 hypothetical protein HMPREF9243_1537 [Aerococcus sp. Group 1]MCY3030209.1 hypothetical protein [Aerococcus sp. Group 1]MCY3054584.1 hypothetical protein [Aerococcus sp. Group 1]MCY3056314.1 hypothetical protein [Aerococcus sp. Group 1]MCY3062492.1 hypothetical protein [Aerococcus sp. Group 1]